MKQPYIFLLAATAAVNVLTTAHMFMVETDRPLGTVSPLLYGLMTEEINHCYVTPS